MQAGECVAPGSLYERVHALGIFHEDSLGVAGPHILRLIGKWIRGVERRCDGTIRENAQIRQIEFGAGLGMKRYRVALSDAQLPQAASNLFGCALVFEPTVCLIIT